MLTIKPKLITKHFLGVLCGTLASLSGASAQPTQFSEIVKIPVSVIIAKDTAWTEKEVRRRIKIANEIYHRDCGINIEIAKLSFTDEGSFSKKGVFDIPSPEIFGKILAEAAPTRPTLFYLKGVTQTIAQGIVVSSTAQALSFGDGDSEANIEGWEFVDAKEFPSLKAFHGVAMISEHYSESYREPYYKYFGDNAASAPGVLDAHELGHILLNSAGHSQLAGNIMTKGGLKFEAHLTTEQCLRMMTYHEREKNLYPTLEAYYQKMVRENFASPADAIKWIREYLRNPGLDKR